MAATFRHCYGNVWRTPPTTDVSAVDGEGICLVLYCMGFRSRLDLIKEAQRERAEVSLRATAIEMSLKKDKK